MESPFCRERYEQNVFNEVKNHYEAIIYSLSVRR